MGIALNGRDLIPRMSKNGWLMLAVQNVSSRVNGKVKANLKASHSKKANY